MLCFHKRAGYFQHVRGSNKGFYHCHSSAAWTWTKTWASHGLYFYIWGTGIMTQSWSVAVRQRGSGELATEKPALESDRTRTPRPHPAPAPCLGCAVNTTLLCFLIHKIKVMLVLKSYVPESPKCLPGTCSRAWSIQGVLAMEGLYGTCPDRAPSTQWVLIAVLIMGWYV